MAMANDTHLMLTVKHKDGNVEFSSGADMIVHVLTDKRETSKSYDSKIKFLPTSVKIPLLLDNFSDQSKTERKKKAPLLCELSVVIQHPLSQEHVLSSPTKIKITTDNWSSFHLLVVERK